MLGNDYPLAQALLVVLSVCVIVANLIMDVLNLILDPRLRTGLMSQLEPTALDLPARPRRARAAEPAARPRAGLARAPAPQPEVAARDRDGRASSSIIALIAPLISVAHPNDFNILATRQAPSWNHLFGTTDQGSDIFSQVVVGARRSLLLGFAAAAARHRRRGDPRDHRRATCGGLVDDVINFLINVFLVDPGDSAPDRHLRLPQARAAWRR